MSPVTLYTTPSYIIGKRVSIKVHVLPSNNLSNTSRAAGSKRSKFKVKHNLAPISIVKGVIVHCFRLSISAIFADPNPASCVLILRVKGDDSVIPK